MEQLLIKETLRGNASASQPLRWVTEIITADTGWHGQKTKPNCEFQPGMRRKFGSVADKATPHRDWAQPPHLHS